MSTYILTYETKTYTFLSKITLNANSKDLNPLTFYYGSDDYGGYFQTDMAFLEYYFANSKAPDLVLQKGKFNYLTSSEGLVAYPNFETYGITGYDSKGNCLYGSKYSSTQNLLIYKNLGDYFCSPVKLQAGDGFQKLFPADYNGDGDDELVRVNYWFQDDHGRVDLTTYDKNMSATNFYFLLEGAFAEGSRRSPVPRTFLTGDFRGTGKTDLVAVSSYVLPKNVTRPNSRTTLIDLSARTKYTIRYHLSMIISRMLFFPLTMMVMVKQISALSMGAGYIFTHIKMEFLNRLHIPTLSETLKYPGLQRRNC